MFTSDTNLSSGSSSNSARSSRSDVGDLTTAFQEPRPGRQEEPVSAVAVPTKGKIEDQMNNENLEMLQKIFEDADEDGGGGLDVEEFGQAMKMAFGNAEGLDDEQLEIMFMKVDTNCDGTVDWEEFCSYMLLENQQKDSMSRDFSDLPFPYPAREISSPHHDSLAKVTYFPSPGLNQCKPGSDSNDFNNSNGRYISCSKDGIFVFWGLDLQIQRTINLTEVNNTGGKGVKQLWVTDVVCLANVKKVAISTTDRDITFYDCSANAFEKQFILNGLDHCVLCMDYWHNPRNLNNSCLLLGDAGGSVSCITFTLATIGLFNPGIGKNNMSGSTVRRIPFQELILGRHTNVSAVTFNNLHGDWVRKVKYIPNLRCFISCANTSESSLFLGDLQSKKMKSFFKIRKGVYSFDYDKENNVIVTGGLDRNVRLWNPYVISKATSVLKGHNSSVSHIVANRDQIISISKDKEIKIWDMKDHCCIQTIPSRLTSIGAHPITTVFYNRNMQTLLMGSNTLTVLERTTRSDANRTEDEPRSHAKPLCGALYNNLFKQVVSACHGSVVNVWHIDTGEKAIMFKNAHDGQEITAMCFDPTKRRLITGSRNGSTKIWNFNNGACLRELHPIDDGEITGIVCPKQRIVTVGWNHNITVYRDVRGAEDDPPKLWNNFHKDDILAVDLTSTGQMATASYDGQVTCWNIESGHIYSQINVNNCVRRRAVSAGTNLNTTDETLKTSAHSKRLASVYNGPDAINRHLSVDKILFLRNRVSDKDTATLLVSAEGVIQAWSILSGLMGQFDATAHMNDESVLAMHSDEYNDVLFTGDSLGYIKIWDISNYCIKLNQTPIMSGRRSSSPLDCFPKKLQQMAPVGTLQIPNSYGSTCSSLFTKSSQSFGTQKSETPFDTLCPPPLCLTSYRGHCSSIVTIDYVGDKQLIVTASADCCVRLWTLNGRYIGTFGQRQSWNSVDNSLSLKRARRIPADIQRVASTQTLKVLKGAAPKWKLAKNIFTILQLGRRPTKARSVNDGTDGDSVIDDETAALSRPQLLDISLTNILGKNYKPKQRHRLPPNIKPKIKNLQCIAFSSLPFSELEPIEEIKMPSILARSLDAKQQHQRTLSPNINDNGTRGKAVGKKGGKLSPLRQLTTTRILPIIAFRR